MTAFVTLSGMVILLVTSLLCICILCVYVLTTLSVSRMVGSRVICNRQIRPAAASSMLKYCRNYLLGRQHSAQTIVHVVTWWRSAYPTTTPATTACPTTPANITFSGAPTTCVATGFAAMDEPPLLRSATYHVFRHTFTDGHCRATTPVRRTLVWTGTDSYGRMSFRGTFWTFVHCRHARIAFRAGEGGSGVATIRRHWDDNHLSVLCCVPY